MEVFFENEDKVDQIAPKTVILEMETKFTIGIECVSFKRLEKMKAF